MIPILVGIFGGGAVASIALARVRGGLWMWSAAFLESLIAFHELSFAFQPTREWIRIDLLLTLPLFTLGNLFMAWMSYLRCPGWWVAGLAGSAVAAPLFLLFSR